MNKSFKKNTEYGQFISVPDYAVAYILNIPKTEPSRLASYSSACCARLSHHSDNDEEDMCDFITDKSHSLAHLAGEAMTMVVAAMKALSNRCSSVIALLPQDRFA